MIVQNHMLQGQGLPEFREPSVAEIADAADVIISDYLVGDDRYDLHRFLGEVILERILTVSRQAKKIPWKPLDDVWWDAAEELATKWTPEQWAQFRERVVA